MYTSKGTVMNDIEGGVRFTTRLTSIKRNS